MGLRSLLAWTSLFARDTTEPLGYVNIPFTRVTGGSSLTKRQIANGSITLSNEQASYLATISVGTPPQSVSLVLDTGSPLTWINAANVTTFTPGSTTTSSSGGAAICKQYTCFTAGSSSTLSVPSNSTIFDITYVDTTESIGRMVEDTLTFQGLTDTTFQLGLVQYFYSPGGTSSAIGGILGLSPSNPVQQFDTVNAALTSTSSTRPSYFNPPTILEQLRDAGRITSLAFSLYLDDATSGEVTLGGVDSGRYSGPLTVLAIEDDPSSQGTSYSVTLQGLGTGGSTSTQVSVGELVVLDSGTTSMYIPYTAIESIADSLNGYFIPSSSSSGILGIPCTVSTTLDFYFANSAVIRIPTASLLEQRISATQARRYGISATSDVCILNVFGTADSSSYLLGDSFLRSAYVVYDIQQNQIAVAQSSYTGTSNVQAIGSGEYGIPQAVYNSSSPNAGAVAVIPSVTRSVTQPTGGGIRTSASGTIAFSTLSDGTVATIAATTGTSRSDASPLMPLSWASLLYTAPFGFVVLGMLVF